jgi:hypothetical protein
VYKIALVLPPGEKDQSRAVSSFFAQAGNEFFKKIMGNLEKNSRTITGFVVGAFGAPVFHAFQDFKPPFQNIVGFPAFNICDKTNAAGIMFMLFKVQTLGALVSPLFLPAHGSSSYRKSYNYTENRGIIQYIYSLYAIFIQKTEKECRCRKEENGSGMKEKNILEVCMKKLLPKLGFGPSLDTTTHLKGSYNSYIRSQR